MYSAVMTVHSPWSQQAPRACSGRPVDGSFTRPISSLCSHDPAGVQSASHSWRRGPTCCILTHRSDGSRSLSRRKREAVVRETKGTGRSSGPHLERCGGGHPPYAAIRKLDAGSPGDGVPTSLTASAWRFNAASAMYGKCRAFSTASSSEMVVGSLGLATSEPRQPHLPRTEDEVGLTHTRMRTPRGTGMALPRTSNRP